MDLRIKKSKDSRVKNKFFQKARLGQSKTKELAIKDIQDECNDFFSRNYIMIEFKVLNACKYVLPIVSINTNVL